MENTLDRRAIDVAPDKPRPAFALVAALLAIPGSTIAWELPLGGLWIGLPLAVVAIVLGMRARRAGGGRGTKTATAAIVIGALAIAQMAAWFLVSAASDADAQAPAARTVTFKELDRGSTLTHIRNTRTRSQRSNSQGDLIAYTRPLADASGARIGKLSMSCTTTTGARDIARSTVTCAGVVVLRDGTLTVQANVSFGSDTTTGAVTGGTGAYANARGVVSVTQTSDGADTTLTLAA